MEKSAKQDILLSLKQEIRLKIERKGTVLKDHDIEIKSGIIPGRERAFFLRTEDKERIVEEDRKSGELIKPAIHNQDIARWQVVNKDRWLITTFPKRRININKYPGIKNHLLAFGKEKLEQSGTDGARSKSKHKWFETQDAVGYFKNLEKPKIIYRESASEGLCCYLDSKGYYYGVNTTFMITGASIRYLIAFLNSSITHAIFCKFYADEEVESKTKRYKKRCIEKLPIPEIKDQNERKKFTDLVAKIVALNESGSDSEEVKNKIDSIQKEIDILVASAYDLTKEEVGYLLNL